MGWFFDRDSPCSWFLYKQRVSLVRKYPKVYPLVWWDWR